MNSIVQNAMLNVRTEGKRTRLAVPVQVKLSGWTGVEIRFPWGSKSTGLDAADLLNPNGTPFSFTALRSAQRELEERARKAKAKRRKSR